MLRIEQTSSLETRTQPELVSLVYRDDVVQKHASKARLQGELDAARASTAIADATVSSGATVDYRIELLIKHMTQAPSECQ